MILSQDELPSIFKSDHFLRVYLPRKRVKETAGTNDIKNLYINGIRQHFLMEKYYP